MINKAVILLAGYEKKLAPLTDEMHQSMFNLGNQTILEDMLEKLQNLHIHNVVLIVGHKAELITQKIGARFGRISIKYVHNTEYLKTNVSYSLWLAKEYLNEDIVLIDGDMIFEEDLLSEIIESPAPDLMAIDYAHFSPEVNHVLARIINDRIVNIGKKIAAKKDNTFARFLGISKFCSKSMELIIDNISKFIESGHKDLFYEDAIDPLLDTLEVTAFNSRRYNWFEIDEADEFEKAKKIFGDTNYLRMKAMQFGADDVFIILPSEIIFDDRALLQCFNCKNFGKKHTCPPFIMDVDYQEMFMKYKKGLLVIVKFDSSVDFDTARFKSTNKLHQIMLKLEKEAFSQDNHFTISFIGGSCKLCPEGCDTKCRHPELSRMPVEATGVDVIETLKKFGLELKFPATDVLYRVGLLMIG